ncbi:MAG: hypothetical protein WC003_13225 [Terrimicrobiaceae bacterium]
MTPPDILENFRWLHAPGAGWGWGVWAFILAGSAALAGSAWYLVRRKKLGLLSFAPPPHQTALRALGELRQRLSEDDQMEFVVGVSQIVRVYIQERFGVRAPHRSTAEFLREAHAGEPVLQEHHELLGGFLCQCDLVKFARRHVVLKQMEALLDSAERFVEGTIPQPKPATEKPA